LVLIEADGDEFVMNPGLRLFTRLPRCVSTPPKITARDIAGTSASLDNSFGIHRG
jgi:hypothetical protein